MGVVGGGVVVDMGFIVDMGIIVDMGSTIDKGSTIDMGFIFDMGFIDMGSTIGVEFIVNKCSKFIVSKDFIKIKVGGLDQLAIFTV